MTDLLSTNINRQNVLKALKNEINETLFFFVAQDLEIYNKITDETFEAFKKQNVEFPKILLKFKNL